jgi:hypothetical protein
VQANSECIAHSTPMSRVLLVVTTKHESTYINAHGSLPYNVGPYHNQTTVSANSIISRSHALFAIVT